MFFDGNLSSSLQVFKILLTWVFLSFPEMCLAVDLSFLGIHRESCICGLVYFITSGKILNYGLQNIFLPTLSP